MTSARDTKRAKRLAVWNSHPASMLEGDLFTHACPECTRWFSNAGGLARHMTTHPPKPLTVRDVELTTGWCFVAHDNPHHPGKVVAHIAPGWVGGFGTVLCRTTELVSRDTVRLAHPVCATCLPIYWRESA